jgi:transcription initiation factor TFIIIB Brf1 subunit/transcription initiation factor TFIIB
MSEGELCKGGVFRCPNCKGTEIKYGYGKRKVICVRCGIPFSDVWSDSSEGGN